MENIDAPFDSGSPFLDDCDGRPRRSVADWGWLTVLAMGVLAVGFFVGGLGPLFAIACDACQDGVRNPHSIDVLIAIAWYVVPLTTLGTVVGIFLPRGGGRAGAIGLGVLVALLLLMVFLGQLV
ncbi:hypothetical protein [Streptomyces sioyaensis]|uniref:hypothetical protein n=1 Tax=Streptomyces sioyaensis TaxID=67364 RepID=UPI0037AA0E1C